jgi:phage shock protein E
MRTYFFPLLLLLGIGACQAQNKESVPEDGGVQVLSVSAFKAKIGEKSVQLIDVRTPQEFAEGHIRKAVNIDVQSADFEARAQALISKDKPIAVYCRSGKRSQRAAASLSDMGYKVIYDLKGGYLAWEAGQ